MSGHEPNDTHQNLFIHNRLDSVGDGTGTTNAIGDYSIEEKVFMIKPPFGVVYRLARMVVVISGGAGVINWNGYGPIAPLVHGVQLALNLVGVPPTVIFDPINIKSNQDWSRNTFDTNIRNSPGQNFLHVLWDFALAGQVQRLDGSKGEYFGLALNDDFTGLTQHTFLVDGEIENTARKS